MLAGEAQAVRWYGLMARRIGWFWKIGRTAVARRFRGALNFRHRIEESALLKQLVLLMEVNRLDSRSGLFIAAAEIVLSRRLIIEFVPRIAGLTTAS